MTLLELIKELEQQDIPEYFRKLDIKGKQVNAHNCPVHNYFKRKGYHVGISSFYIRLYRGNSLLEKHKTPPNIADFIINFDIGEYPDLVEYSNVT